MLHLSLLLLSDLLAVAVTVVCWARRGPISVSVASLTEFCSRSLCSSSPLKQVCCSSLVSQAARRPLWGTGSVRCIPSGKQQAMFNAFTVYWRITQTLVESPPRGVDASLTLALMSVGVEKAVEAAAGSFESTQTRTLKRKHKHRTPGILFRSSHYNINTFFCCGLWI